MAKRAKCTPNVSNTAANSSQVSGKSITTTATTVLALHGAAPSSEVIVGWAIDGLDDQGAGANRGAILVGDSSDQKKYIAAGTDLDTNNYPVHDPANVYVKSPSGTVSNVVVTLFYDNSGEIDAD